MGAGLNHRVDPVATVARVQEFLAAPQAEAFDDLALEVVRLQMEANEAYRRFCERRGVSAASIASWRDAPAVPTAAFQHVDLVVAGLHENGGSQHFRTSGTTSEGASRGTHHVPVPEIYRRAALEHFRELVLPDGARPRFVVVAPSVSEVPDSSLCQMIAWLAAEFGSAEPEYFVAAGDVHCDALAERLRSLEGASEPLCVFAVTYGLIRFLDHCRSAELRFRLPYASRVVDTGGTKGRSRSMSRKGLIRAIWESLGVAGYYVANEYGMTEMCSQFYEDAIRSHIDGRKRDRSQIGPPWVRTTLVDPVTLEPTAADRGLLRHFDLANIGSVSALQTEDVGGLRGEGFEVLGRAEGAEARGCSLLLRDALP